MLCKKKRTFFFFLFFFQKYSHVDNMQHISSFLRIENYPFTFFPTKGKLYYIGLLMLWKTLEIKDWNKIKKRLGMHRENIKEKEFYINNGFMKDLSRSYMNHIVFIIFTHMLLFLLISLENTMAYIGTTMARINIPFLSFLSDNVVYVGLVSKWYNSAIFDMLIGSYSFKI